MTYREIQDEIIGLRFKEGDRDSVKRWITLRERQVFNYQEWPFRRVMRESWTVDSQTPTVPTGLHRVVRIERADGWILNRLDEDEFFDTYLVNDEASGDAIEYTTSGGLIWLGPTPSGTSTYSISYARKLCHYNSSDVLTIGAMSANDDYPIWDEDYHYMLVQGGMSTGLKLNNDMTWEPLEGEFNASLVDMTDHYIPEQYGNTQYGRDTL